ncbi:MAG: flippase-like domain-containing protein [Chloroflexi bacterium]|nr:flippase-like domain-containing protein [Chloroflexota bacterium]
MTHEEGPEIQALALEVDRTDERAVQRRLFGWREAVSFLIPVALVAFFARNVDWSEAWATLAGSHLGWVAAALAVYYVSFPVRAWRWSFLLRAGGAAIPVRPLLRILMLGWFVNCLLPAKLGDLYRSYLVKRRFGVSLSRTVGVVVAERLLDLLCVFVLLIVGGYVAFGRAVLPDLRILYLSGALLAIGIVVGIAVVYFVAPRLARFFPAPLRRIGRLFREGVLHSFRALPAAGPLTGVVWSTEVLRLLFVLLALGLELPYSGVAFVAVATSLLTTVPLAPAGFGVVEIGMVYILTAGFGLSTHDAVAVALLDRAVSIFSVIVIGAVLYVRNAASERFGGETG